MTVPEFYTCRHCSTAKTADNFYPNSRVKCKACISKKNKEKYRQKNDNVRTYIKGGAPRPPKVKVAKKACPACDKQHPVSDGVLCSICVRSESVRKQHGILTSADFSLINLNRRERMLLFLWAIGQDISDLLPSPPTTITTAHPTIDDLPEGYPMTVYKEWNTPAWSGRINPKVLPHNEEDASHGVTH
jgi:hypothetical protein